jgi:hypothetical protein
MANLAEDLLQAVADMTAETKSLRKLCQRLEAKLDGDSSLEFLTKDTQSKTEETPKEASKLTGPLAKLLVALKAHKADFANSELAELARELYDSAKLKHIVLAWSHKHKEPSVSKWAKARDNAQINTWLKRQVG